MFLPNFFYNHLKSSETYLKTIKHILKIGIFWGGFRETLFVEILNRPQKWIQHTRKLYRRFSRLFTPLITHRLIEIYYAIHQNRDPGGGAVIP